MELVLSAPRSDGLSAVARAIADARMGLPVIVTGERPDDARWMVSAEFVDAARVSSLGDTPVQIVMARPRADALGLINTPDREREGGVYAARLDGPLTQDGVAALADPGLQSKAPLPVVSDIERFAPPSVPDAAVQLAKLARLLPTVVIGPVASGVPLTTVSATDIRNFSEASAQSLKLVAEARVPLRETPDVRLLAFRPADGGFEHLALVVGNPDVSSPVLVRLHSECLTGDLLGSLRCDCGDQLRGALRTMAAHGSGILLYLAQEGRGIGLVNKLRAYGLQDRGFDTLDANGQLGFEDDERLYLPAAEMLRKLGVSQVRLLTNNPLKIEALSAHGIDVTERVPHAFAANDHNRTYLETKARRGGHLL